ncbi:energy-coupling factor ABC transporter permease, partial [bacterium]|nr:energy-coupling factor ABC transporter permease [bacterium]
MHIPDGYLSPATAGTLYAFSAPFWYMASRKTKAILSGRLVPLMALLSATCFVLQMINIPLPGGTTGHAAGASLAAIVLTPWPAVLAV